MTTAAVGWPQNTKTSAARATAEMRSTLQCVCPRPHRAGAQAGLLAAVADPAQSARERLPDPDGGHRRPGQERAGDDDQARDQDRAHSLLDEPDERVEQGRSGVGGQHIIRPTAQVDAAEDQQPGGRHQHRRSEAQAGADQGTAAPPGQRTPRGPAAAAAAA
jgi:hypothetical protein